MNIFKNIISERKRLLVFWHYLQSAFLVLIVTIIGIPVHSQIDAVNLLMLYLAAVVFVAVILGRGPATLASLLSVIAFDYYFIDPRLSFTIGDSEYLLTFFGLLIVGLVTSTATDRLKRQVEITRQKEAFTAALNSLSKDLTGACDLDDMLRSVVHHIYKSFTCRVLVLLPEENGNLRLAADSNPDTRPGENQEIFKFAIQKAKEIFGLPPQKKIFQQGMDGYLPSSTILFFPLLANLEKVGVLGVIISENHALQKDNAQQELLQGFANLTALAIERAHLVEQASQAKVMKDIEQLQAALLNCVSHELRSPLVSITGALSSLLESASTGLINRTDNAARIEMIETAYEDAFRMNLLVGNLLDMSRLESGALKLNLEPCDLQDLVGIALERFSKQYSQRIVIIDLPEDLPLIDLDALLMVEVIVNLLINASKYSPPNTPIHLSCRQNNRQIEIEISDHGSGVPSEELDRIFDKFYRSPNAYQLSGLGLGLSISKGFVQAHGGRIIARNLPLGGFSVIIRLHVTHKDARHE